MRKTPLVAGEFYHIYNRRVEGLPLVRDKYDVVRFAQSLIEFNTTKPIGSIYENRYKKDQSDTEKSGPLVQIFAYNLLPNHYHLVVKQVAENGVSNFIKSLAGGYAKYFNEKYDRAGSLFQNPFQAKHIDANVYFAHVTSYVHLNHFIHGRGRFPEWLGINSWDELQKPYKNTAIISPAERDFLMSDGGTLSAYLCQVKDIAATIIERRYDAVELDPLFIEKNLEVTLGNQVSKSV